MKTRHTINRLRFSLLHQRFIDAVQGERFDSAHALCLLIAEELQPTAPHKLTPTGAAERDHLIAARLDLHAGEQ